MLSPSSTIPTAHPATYVPRGANTLLHIFHAFADACDSLYAQDYCKFRLERISHVGFLGVFPAITADFWGSKNMGVSYGIILLGFGIGAIASSSHAGCYKELANIKEVVGGVTKVMGTDLRKMQPAFVIASVASVASIASVAGLVLMAALKPPVPKKK